MERVIKILVPIDFSECSENSLAFAIQLADKIKAHLILLNVLKFDSGSMENFAHVTDELEIQTEQSRINIIKSIQKVTENVRASIDETPAIRTNVEIGNVEATICDVASRNQVDYVIMGTQGENSALDKYLGSVASNVLKKAPCPVMVIPENVELSKKLVLGYATDFLDADPFEIWKAMKLFKPFQPIIKCVHFNEKQVYNEDKIKELEVYFAETAPELNVELYSLPVKDKITDMNNFIEEHNINMLVMYKPKRSFFKSIFHKSYTQKMAKHTNIPLLVFKENN